MFGLKPGLDTRSLVYGLITPLREVEVHCKKKPPEGDIPLNISVDAGGRLGDAGNSFCVGQGKDLINNVAWG